MVVLPCHLDDHLRLSRCWRLANCAQDADDWRSGGGQIAEVHYANPTEVEANCNLAVRTVTPGGDRMRDVKTLLGCIRAYLHEMTTEPAPTAEEKDCQGKELAKAHKAHPSRADSGLRASAQPVPRERALWMSGHHQAGEGK